MDRGVRERLGDNVDEKLLHDFLPAYMINLSPFTQEYTWKSAKSQASRLLSKPRDIEALLQMASSIQEKHADYLRPIRTEIETLANWVSSHNSQHVATEKMVDSAAALFYLANPYSGIFDFSRRITQNEDLGIIRDTFSKHSYR